MRHFVMIAVFLGLAACETVGGMGRDIESAGETIENTAAETEQAM